MRLISRENVVDSQIQLRSATGCAIATLGKDAVCLATLNLSAYWRLITLFALSRAAPIIKTFIDAAKTFTMRFVCARQHELRRAWEEKIVYRLSIARR